jgi:hypothetical protein
MGIPGLNDHRGTLSNDNNSIKYLYKVPDNSEEPVTGNEAWKTMPSPASQLKDLFVTSN